jgi:hypothetical protein
MVSLASSPFSLIIGKMNFQSVVILDPNQADYCFTIRRHRSSSLRCGSHHRAEAQQRQGEKDTANQRDDQEFLPDHRKSGSAIENCLRQRDEVHGG